MCQADSAWRPKHTKDVRGGSQVPSAWMQRLSNVGKFLFQDTRT